MARLRRLSSEELATQLRVNGPMPADALARHFRVDQSTISRRLAELGESIVRIGSARRSRYGLLRDVRGRGVRWPLYRIGPRGNVAHWCTLQALHDGWILAWDSRPAWLGATDAVDDFWDHLPFFLQAARPQGFLGRLEARRVSRILGVSQDANLWSEDDLWTYLLTHGEDLVGDLVPGEDNLTAAQTSSANPSPLITDQSLETEYPRLAQRVLSGEIPGSSAAGEQPKFLAWRGEGAETAHAVIVKFSPPRETSVGQRWADLLEAEAVARNLLRELGLTTGFARTFDLADRRFLEVPRFDRVGPDGRRGFLALETLVAAFGDSPGTDWTSRVSHFHKIGLVEEHTVRTTAQLDFFGQLIGNTDRHGGNLSFHFGDTLPFELAPIYDMLPMHWAPLHGEIRSIPFQPPVPRPEQRNVGREALSWAQDFWQSLGRNHRLSEDFRSIANGALRSIEKLEKRFIE